MPTTLLDGESYEQALHRRMQEEAAFQPASHTPGPWSVSNEVEDGWRMVMANGKIVANVNPESFSVGVADFLEMPAEANARLIAAAPELLEALIDLIDKYDSLIDAEYGGTKQEARLLADGNAARAAIAKAKWA